MAPLVLGVLVLDEHVLVEDLVDVVLGRGVTLPSSSNFEKRTNLFFAHCLASNLSFYLN